MGVDEGLQGGPNPRRLLDGRLESSLSIVVHAVIVGAAAAPGNEAPDVSWPSPC
jgi:hypothetical protein